MTAQLKYSIEFASAAFTAFAMQQRQFFDALKAETVVTVQFSGIAIAERAGKLPQIIDYF